jgi:iron(III) transport system substrate-binding protein
MARHVASGAVGDGSIDPSSATIGRRGHALARSAIVPSAHGPTASCTRREAIVHAGRAVLAGSAMTLLGSACAREGVQRMASGRVLVYTSADDVLAKEVLAACTRATGVEVVGLFDTEATKTTALESRIRAERDRPRADIFWSSEGFAVLRLARDGLLAAIPEDIWSTWPARHRDPARQWLAFAARARVVVMRRGFAPLRHWADLAKPGLGLGLPPGNDCRIAIADPRFGTTSSHIAALEQVWREAATRGAGAGDAAAFAAAVPSFDAWVDGMRANGVEVLPGGNAATVDAVARGQCAYGLTDTDDALVAIDRGMPIEMCLPRTLPDGAQGGGTMLVPNTVAPILGGPGDSDAVRKVLGYLVSPECELLIARSPSRNLPLGEGVRAELPYAESDPLAFDALRASAGAAELAVRVGERLSGRIALHHGLGPRSLSPNPQPFPSDSAGATKA